MSKLKIGGAVLVALLVTLGLGWFWGASGRWAVERQARDAEVRLQVTEARAALAAARVDVFELNFGRASRNLERAKKALADVGARMEKDGPADSAAAVREAAAKAAEAQQLAGNVDQTANARAAEALNVLDRVKD
ncbi:MAG TPA: hypothetical protein VGK32_09870 [Vicinamibacterales bacterium]|jgi:hypothetical protein